MYKEKNSLLSGALAMTLSVAIVKIIGVLYKVPLSYMLGEEGMGYFNSAYTVYGFFYVISSAGTPKAVTMLFARMEKGFESGALESICRRLLRIFAFFGIAVTLAFILLASPISALIGNKKAVYTMLTIAPTILFTTISGVLRGYLNGRSRMLPIAISQLIEASSKLVLGLIFAFVGIKLTLSVPIVSCLSILGITLGSFFSLLYMYISCFRKSDARAKTRIPQEKGIFKEVIQAAIPITLSAAVGAASGVIDLTLVINGLRSSGFSEEVANAIYGNYSTLAIPMVNLVSSLLLPITMVLLPRLAATSVKSAEFSNTLERAFRVSLALATPVAIIYALYSFDILDILFASGVSANGSSALSALSPSVVLLPLLTVVNTALEASGKMGKALLSLSLGLLVKLIVSIVLIPNTEFGIIGAALGTVASYLFSLLLSLLFLGGAGKGIRIGSSAMMISLAVASYYPPYLLVYGTNLFANPTLSMIISLIISTVAYIIVVLPAFFSDCINEIKGNNAQKIIALRKRNS